MSRSTALDDYRWLCGDEGARWLSEARLQAETQTSPLAAANLLQRHLPPDRARLVLEQAHLRSRAASKFAAAERMFFTARGLEQSSDETIAAYKAARFPVDLAVADLCAGIGGDLIALAARGPALGVERDPVVALLAFENLRRCGVATRGNSCICVGDVGSGLIADGVTLHLDPDRRPNARRTTHLEAHDPPQEVIERLVGRAPGVAIKLAPATRVTDTWSGQFEREWISRDGVCRQQVVWCGELAQQAGRRAATVVLSKGNKNPGTCTISASAHDALIVAAAQRIASYLFDPDPAVLAADLLATLAAQLALQPVDPQSVYLTGDAAVLHPMVSSFEVLETMPFRPPAVRRWLAEKGLRVREIKTRGCGVDPDKLRPQLSTRDGKPCTLFVLRQARKVIAVATRRLTTRDAPHDGPAAL